MHFLLPILLSTHPVYALSENTKYITDSVWYAETKLCTCVFRGSWLGENHLGCQVTRSWRVYERARSRIPLHQCTWRRHWWYLTLFEILTSQDISLCFDSFWPFPFWRLCLDHTRCNAWVLDGDFYHKGLQGVAVPVDAIGNTLLLITVDMSRPWNALDSLQKWAMVAREHVDKLRVPPETLRELEHRRESSSENTSFVLPVLVCFFFFSSTLLLTQSRSDATAHLRPQWGQAV